ncbi:CidA/LrgA family protein [Psychromonas sp. RZ22]|uniref:CidA/LrgA family protein n=1 Tax=Psychromonas algarum TaxID=2555643 RepID=UPI001067F52F|nr:CidA/LrgA family protein [Psychromonas sp. RZ22]TEW54563.1 CidA/LrgA family protein [Psychromonas sp. RZ22]
MKKNGFTLLQVALLCAMWILADIVVKKFSIPLPSNVLGMLILFILLLTGIVKVKWFKLGAMWLLAEMLLFFIPAVISIVNYQEIVLSSGLKILAVIMISTVFVLGITAKVVEKIYEYEVRKLDEKKLKTDIEGIE